MTNQEQKTINDLCNVINQLNAKNEKVIYELNQKIQLLENKIEQKNIPLNLENEIINTAKNSIVESFKKSLSDNYNSPLKKYAENVITRYQTSIENIFDEIIKDNINNENFKIICKDELLHKIAKTVISGIDGSVDKVVNDIKQNSVFRSKLTLFVNNLVEEFLKSK